MIGEASAKARAVSPLKKTKQVPFSMAVGHVELMHECFPKHSGMGTAKMKWDNETEKDGKKRGVSMKKK